jgi:hypothetical protein
MRFSKLTRTSRLNEGYDLKAIKEQIASLFRGKLYTPPKVVMEGGTPVCTLITISKSHVAVHIEVALSDDEDELVVQTVTDWDSMDTISKLLDDQKNFIEDVIAPKEQAIIEILRSK